MKNAWWIVIVVIVLVICGFLWYQHATPAQVSAPTAEQTTTTASATSTPAAAVVARDNSDTSLNADLNDINNQMTGLNTDAEAAQ